jgi:hypothetical protein
MTNDFTAQDKNSNMLVSRVAGLGVLHHNPIGFTGPLSQHLLGYNSIINVVQQTLRDLVEVAATQMLLTGCCKRNADISSIAMKYVIPTCEGIPGILTASDYPSSYPIIARSVSPSSLTLTIC